MEPQSWLPTLSTSPTRSHSWKPTGSSHSPQQAWLPHWSSSRLPTACRSR